MISAIRIVVRMHRAAILIAMLYVAGCATSPPARYYDLVAEDPGTVVKSDDRIVGIGPFAMPEYLKRPQIVVRDGGNALTLSEFDRWVEAPDQAFTRWLSGLTDARLPVAVVGSYPDPVGAAADVRVRGSVRRWDVDASGRAVLIVQWEVVDSEGATLLPVRTSRFVAEGIDPTDYGAIVDGMRETLEGFATEIAGGVGEALMRGGSPQR